MVKNQRKVGVILSYINLFISIVIPFLYTPIMLSVLGQSEYGLYSLASSVTSYLNLLSFGMGTTVTRYITKYKAKNEKEKIERILGLFLFVYGLISIVIIIVGFLLSYFSNNIFANGLNNEEIYRLKILIILMTFSVPIGLISSVYTSLILVYEKFTFNSVIGLIGTIIAPIANLISLYMGFESIGLACSSIIIQICFLPVDIIFCKSKLSIRARFDKIPFNKLKNVFSFSLIIFLSSIADLLFWATDKVLIGSALGAVQVAIYNIGGTFTTIFRNMTSVISRIFSPEANNIVFENKPIEESSNLLIRIGRIQYYIASLIVSGFIVFGQTFLTYWAGIGYENAYYVTLLTMIPMVIPLIQNIAFVTVTAMKKHLFRSIVYIVIAIVNVISTFFIIPYYGIIGAALCTALAYVLGQGVFLNYYYWKVIKLDILKFWINIITMTLVPGVMVVICLVLQRFFSITSFAQLFVYIIVYTIIYCILSWIFTMNEYEKGLISSLFERLFRRHI